MGVAEGRTENDDSTLLGPAGSTTPSPPPPDPLYHNRGGDYGFDKGGNLGSLLHTEMKKTTPTGINGEGSEGECHVVEMGRTGVDDDDVGAGVYLTWEDLCVTVHGGKDRDRAILEACSGYAESGSVLAVIGPSGSGKTTLLDALAGRLASNTRQSGNILVNGRRQPLAFGTSAYVTQDDVLLRTLTVAEAVYYSAQLQLPDSMSNAEKWGRAEATIKEMGLQDAMGTRIGNISGGQKRRVSICLEILTRPHLLFLDEPTSGLDSAASYHVMHRISCLSTQKARTIIVSIHQPSGEVFDLFHNLCILSYGKTIYFGPTSNAVQFFAKNGFPCPPMKNPADHYLRTINKDFEQAEDDRSNYSTTKLSIDVLASSYKSSDYLQEVTRRVNQLSQKQGPKLRKGSDSGFLNQCFVLTRRSSVNMSRDIGYYWLRFSVYLSIAIALGTVFYQLGFGFSAIMDRASALMFVSAFMTFMTIGGFPSFVEDMKIFQRERLNGHYGVGAYVISHTLSSAPFLLLVSLIPAVISYYLIGLQPSFHHFIYFALVLYLCMFLIESLMMLVASVVPDFLMGVIIGADLQGLMMLTGGVFRLPPDIPKPVWKYPCYYFSIHKYAFQGLNKNEFIGLTFTNKIGYFPPRVSGVEILRGTFELELGYSKWVDLAILAGMLVVYRVLFFVIIKVVEKVKPIVRTARGCRAKKVALE